MTARPEALCSPPLHPKKTLQSFQFLVDVSEFRALFHAQQHGDEGEDHYDRFVCIVDEYVKASSSSEVNIDSGTREAILAFGERSEYEALGPVRRRPPRGGSFAPLTTMDYPRTVLVVRWRESCTDEATLFSKDI